jgi:hypothetical protein
VQYQVGALQVRSQTLRQSLRPARDVGVGDDDGERIHTR